jgi:transmembrane sensor
MQKNTTRFNDLWSRNLQGLVTTDEFVELHHMIVSGEYKLEITQLARQAMEAEGEYILISEEADTRMHDEVMRQREVLDNVQEYTSRERMKSVLAMAIGVVVLAVAAWWTFRDWRVNHVAAGQNIELVGKRYMRLPDGTAVTMNEGSTLTYSPAFGDSIREVMLVGEAFFDVVHDPAHPFVVHTPDGINTIVLGTAFNVRADPDQPTTVVTVERGRVRVGTDARELAVLTPAQTITVKRQTLVAEHSAVNMEEVMAWRKPMLIMDGVSLRVAAEKIAQHFNVRVIVGNPEFQACQISLSFLHNESIEEVLTIIDDVTGSSHLLVDGAYIITGSYNQN